MNLRVLTALVFFAGQTCFGFETMQVAGAVNTSKATSMSGELALSVWQRAIPERSLYIGPKLGVLLEGDQTSSSRLSLQAGGEGVLWFVNAIGLGASMEAIGDFSRTTRFRLDPFVAVRLLRFQREGAWAVRVGVPYDTRYQWGVQVGVTLQPSGIPVFGD
jgi:hypothetical protein